MEELYFKVSEDTINKLLEYLRQNHDSEELIKLLNKSELIFQTQ
jgi:CDP-glycerol glycerophosphotransferase (TagB/SpsB family)